jgi:hypothetical protein
MIPKRTMRPPKARASGQQGMSSEKQRLRSDFQLKTPGAD